MKVSVIMCSYNGGEYLRKAIDCIVNQTYQDWELIISDDRSPDNSVEIIESYLDDPRIKFYNQENNLGYIPNKNFAMSKATGELVTQLDCDDMCPHDRLEKQVNVFLNNPDIKLCGSAFKPIDTGDNSLADVPEFREYGKTYSKDFMVTEPQVNYPFWFPGLMFKRELFDEFGYFSEYFIGTYGDDHYWTIRANSKYPIYVLKDQLYYYRINPGSITNVMDNPRKMIAQDIIKELHRLVTETGTDWLQENKPEEGKAFEESIYNNKGLMAERYRVWAAKATDKKNWKQAKELIKKHFANTITDINGYKTLAYYLRSRYL